jgi:hypothetical protein
MAIQWSSWASLGKPVETEIGRPFAQRNLDGRLEVLPWGWAKYSIFPRSFQMTAGEIAGAARADPHHTSASDRMSSGRMLTAARKSFR